MGRLACNSIPLASKRIVPLTQNTCRLLATATIAVWTTQVRTATTGRVRSTRTARTTRGMWTSIRATWIGTTTTATTDNQCGQSALSTYWLWIENTSWLENSCVLTYFKPIWMRVGTSGINPINCALKQIWETILIYCARNCIIGTTNPNPRHASSSMILRNARFSLQIFEIE